MINVTYTIRGAINLVVLLRPGVKVMDRDVGVTVLMAGVKMMEGESGTGWDERLDGCFVSTAFSRAVHR